MSTPARFLLTDDTSGTEILEFLNELEAYITEFGFELKQDSYHEDPSELPYIEALLTGYTTAITAVQGFRTLMQAHGWCDEDEVN